MGPVPSNTYVSFFLVLFILFVKIYYIWIYKFVCLLPHVCEKAEDIISGAGDTGVCELPCLGDGN